MKFLFLAREDCAGVAHKLKVAADSVAGHSARAVSMFATELCYPRDIIRPDENKLDELRGWADAIVMFDGWARDKEVASGKKLAAVYNGSGYRGRWRHSNERDAALGIVQFGTTIDLTCSTYGSSLAWLPVPMEVAGSTPPKTHGVFHVFHSPTHRGRKGTERIIEELRDLDGVTLEIVEGVANKECLRKKARAHLYVDQFCVGYGVNALEAWSLGMPVIADTQRLPDEYGAVCPDSKEITGRMLDEIGGVRLPFIECDIRVKGMLRFMVSELLSSGELYRVERDRGMDYLKKFHSAEAVVGRLISALEKGA